MWFNLDDAVTHNLLQHACVYISFVLMFICTYSFCISRQKYLNFLFIWKNKQIIKYNYLLSSSKRLQFLIFFFHSETNLKSALGPVGNRSSPLGLGAPQPWPLHHRANCWTATLFSFYLIGFFHSETNVKELAAKPGIDPRPLNFKHRNTAAPISISSPPVHHRDFSISPNPFLSLLNQLTLRLFKGLWAQAS